MPHRLILLKCGAAAGPDFGGTLAFTAREAPTGQCVDGATSVAREDLCRLPRRLNRRL
jgi:hypothetical protein